MPAIIKRSWAASYPGRPLEFGRRSGPRRIATGNAMSRTRDVAGVAAWAFLAVMAAAFCNEHLNDIDDDGDLIPH